MNDLFCYGLPSDNLKLRRAIYGGAIFQIGSTTAARELVGRTLDMVREVFGNDFRRSHCQFDEPTFAGKIRQIKQAVAGDSRIRQLSVQAVGKLGFLEDDILLDAVRVRVVSPRSSLAAHQLNAYSAHRDTWYGNSQSQINLWMPLTDLSSAETFMFFPQYFDRPIANDSDHFNYDTWKTEVGFGNSQLRADAFYPTVENKLLDPDSAIGFDCTQADVLLFSASQLHQSAINRTDFSRFSLDFRIVHKEDHLGGIGAPNVDNRSQGNATVDYESASKIKDGISR